MIIIKVASSEDHVIIARLNGSQIFLCTRGPREMVTGNARCKSTGIEPSHRYPFTVLKYKQLSRLGIRRFS